MAYGLVNQLDVDEVPGFGFRLSQTRDLELVIGAETSHRWLACVAVGSPGELLTMGASQIRTDCSAEYDHLAYSSLRVCRRTLEYRV